MSVGTINGLIFYANLISINKTDYFGGASHSFFSVFIDWLNLDFGIETCYYNGLSTYQWMWLQYAFPFYMWSLVIIIIAITHKCSRVMKALGRNLIPVLSTLFLFSYTKLLKTTTLSLSSATVYTSVDENEPTAHLVWLLNGNIHYLQGKHIPLFAIGILILLFLFLPYTILLLFGQCLRMLPRRRGLMWVNSNTMISILDSYHAPYRKRHRFWTGLLLVIRCVVFTMTIYRGRYNIQINLIATLLAVLFILMYKWIIGPVYNKTVNNKLEDFFLLVLLISTTLTLHYRNNHTAKNIIMKLSVGVTLIVFTLILSYHLLLQVKTKGLAFFQRFCDFISKKHQTVVNNITDSNNPNEVQIVIGLECHKHSLIYENLYSISYNR